MKDKDIEEIFKDNLQIELADGDKLIGPGPCPLKISDWMNFLISLWTSYDKGLIQFKTWMYTSVLLYFAMGTFLLSVFVNLTRAEEPASLLFPTILIYSGVFIGSRLTISHFGKMMKYKVKARNSIYVIINSIIWGTLRNSDMIRNYFDTVIRELHIEANKVIKELKLDKK